MDVLVHWKPISSEDDPMWEWARVLHTFVHRDEILYIGKVESAYSCVRTRLLAEDKARNVLEPLRRQRGIDGFTLLVGMLAHEGRFSRAILADVESLLIQQIQPWANIQCTTSRIARVDLRVRCTGNAWPHDRSFRDVA